MGILDKLQFWKDRGEKGGKPEVSRVDDRLEAARAAVRDQFARVTEVGVSEYAFNDQDQRQGGGITTAPEVIDLVRLRAAAEQSRICEVALDVNFDLNVVLAQICAAFKVEYTPDNWVTISEKLREKSGALVIIINPNIETLRAKGGLFDSYTNRDIADFANFVRSLKNSGPSLIRVWVYTSDRKVVPTEIGRNLGFLSVPKK
jgi:hypothetical protein